MGALIALDGAMEGGWMRIGRGMRGALLACAGVLLTARGAGALEALEKRCGGRLGVLAVDTGSGRTLEHRAGERFLLCSTFKLPLVARVYQRVHQGAESLGRVIPFGLGDVLEYAPVTARHADGKGMTVEALVGAILEASDNTAANLLLASVGGPAGLTAWLRGLGDATTRLDRTEPALNTPLPGRDDDTTTPAAMVADLRRILLGDVLPDELRHKLLEGLEAGPVGAARLKAGLPPGWRIAHKTGSGDDGATNDIGILYPPGRAPILVAAYYSGSKAPREAREAVLAEVGRIVSTVPFS
jgi:beta-lactamase class A